MVNSLRFSAVYFLQTMHNIIFVRVRHFTLKIITLPKGATMAYLLHSRRAMLFCILRFYCSFLTLHPLLTQDPIFPPNSDGLVTFSTNCILHFHIKMKFFFLYNTVFCHS